MSIDPLARISRDARIGAGVSIGPFSVIEAGAVIGDGCKISARVTIKSGVRLGKDNVVEDNAVLGGRPQHLQRIENPGTVEIGDRNVIRENVTIHRAMKPEAKTTIGNDCLLMVG
ncbi:MAG: acyl-ACP--UDP-N-acetylglucosamine O-acyltransferase, partial [Planctomycetales bacterium]|nr:acyl-ACP--UDP-N-acetylglucosamine O-acyltransferase [Planctomycetales bacterium]